MPAGHFPTGFLPARCYCISTRYALCTDYRSQKNHITEGREVPVENACIQQEQPHRCAEKCDDENLLDLIWKILLKCI